MTKEEKRLAALARAKAWYENNKAAKQAYDKAYRVKNREMINARFNEWRRANFAEQKAKEDARRALKPEQYAASRLEWRKKNAAALKAYEAKRARTAARKALTKKAHDAWNLANPEQRRNQVRNRRAKLRDGGVLSKDIEQRLMVAQNGECAACKTDIREKFHLDHIIPVAQGGPNVDANVQLLCPFCNQSKGARPHDVFLRSLAAAS